MHPVAVDVAGEEVEVDIKSCAPQAETLQQLRDASEETNGIAHAQLGKVPGGAAMLRSIQSFLKAAGDEPLEDDQKREACLRCLESPHLSADSMADYLQAAAVIRSPQFLHSLAQSRVCKAFTSSQASPLLQQVLLLSVGTEESDSSQSSHLQLSDAMEEAFADTISCLCSQLDLADFCLGPALATGSARASLQVLRCYRAKQEDGSSTCEWNEHRFALHVIRRHLTRETEIAKAAGILRDAPLLPDSLLVGAEPDDQPEERDTYQGAGATAEADISEEVCDRVPDMALMKIVFLVDYIEYAITPPFLAAVMIRAQLLVGREDQARFFFQAVFTQAHKVQEMVVTRQIPASFLRCVSEQRAASVVLRQMLAMYMAADPEELCDLLEDVLFSDLMQEQHASEVILKHALMRDLVPWLRSGGVARGSRTTSVSSESVTSSSVRLGEVGVQLFSATFLAHNGYLPEATAECAWDDGSLDLPLLAHVPSTEDALQLARCVLLRCLWQGVTEGAEKYDVHAIKRLWALGRWPLCHDAALIAKALAFLSACWRAVSALPGLGDLAGFPLGGEAGLACGSSCAPGASNSRPRAPGLPQVKRGSVSGTALIGTGSRRLTEEIFFKMFTDLEVWRLPNKELLTPWVPGQVLACHVSAQCRQLQERQTTLVEESRENLEEISRLHATIGQLTARLEATDARSQQCMQRQADLNDTLRALR